MTDKESTAKGEGDWFHEAWIEAVENESSDLFPVFIPWYWNTGYKRKPTEEQLKEGLTQERREEIVQLIERGLR